MVLRIGKGPKGLVILEDGFEWDKLAEVNRSVKNLHFGIFLKNYKSLNYEICRISSLSGIKKYVLQIFD